jgi:hypothetical protein
VSKIVPTFFAYAASKSIKKLPHPWVDLAGVRRCGRLIGLHNRGVGTSCVNNDMSPRQKHLVGQMLPVATGIVRLRISSSAFASVWIDWYLLILSTL